jgi:serine/threonine protein kinase
LTQSGNVIGTPDFMAPEQARNSHLVDGRADLYSLGCTLYTILTHKLPYPGGTGLEKLFRHQEEEPIPIKQHRPDLPDAVAAVVRKLMAKRPDDRYQTAGEAAAALAALSPRRAANGAGKRSEKSVRTTMVDRTPARVATAVSKPTPPARPRSALARLRWSWPALGVATSFLVVGLSLLAYVVTRTLLIRP